MKLILNGRTTTFVEELQNAFVSINGNSYYGNFSHAMCPEGREMHYLDAALVVTTEEEALLSQYQLDKLPLCRKDGLHPNFNIDVEDLFANDYSLAEFGLGVIKFVFDDINSLAIVESQIENGVRNVKQQLWAASGIQREAMAPTLPEASLFLLLLAANVDTTTDRFGLEAGELSGQEESFILELCNNWGFYVDFRLQNQLEAAIGKYQRVKGYSLNREDLIEQCAELLRQAPALRDITYYLCLKILFLNGLIPQNSPEDDLAVTLQRVLEVDPAVGDFVWGLEVFRATVVR